MEFKRTTIPTRGLSSLAWTDDALVDWVGGHRFSLDGETERFNVGSSYRCDSAVGLGRIGVAYELLGTKGLVRRANGQKPSGNYVPVCADLVREVNRSYYHADNYPYPVALFTHAGEALLAHCPRGYNILDIEDVEGKCLTSRPIDKAHDVFHSRLEASVDGAWLLSNGWVWHPYRVACVYDVARALREPNYLSTDGEKVDLGEQWEGEVEAATFVGDRLVCATSEEGPAAISVYNLRERRHELFEELAEAAGTRMMALDDDHVVLFDAVPRVLCLSSGATVYRFDDVEGTKAEPGPSHSAASPCPPHVAMDPASGRFALGWPTQIVVFERKLP